MYYVALPLGFLHLPTSDADFWTEFSHGWRDSCFRTAAQFDTFEAADKAAKAYLSAHKSGAMYYAILTPAIPEAA